MLTRKTFVFRYSFLIVAFLLGSFFLFNESSKACSSFCLKDGDTLLLGNNFDFWTGTARVLINKRGVSKTAFIPPFDKPLKWVSKYGSITFDQAGWDFPYQGMNEAGLVVAQMWFDNTKYSAPDQRGSISSLQWIQYQLDTAQSVDEVISSEKNIRINQLSSLLHFLVCDRSGKIASIEFIDGKQLVSTGDGLPYPVLTNNAYSEAVSFTNEYKKNARLNDIPKTDGFSERFGRAAAMLLNYKKQKPAVDYAFDILKEVSLKEVGSSQTRYSIVFDIGNGKISYRSQKNEKIRMLTMKDFDYSCKSPVLGLDVDSDVSRGKDDFQIFTIEMNRILIEKVITECEFLKNALGPIKEFLINYPQSLSCTDAGK